MSELQCLIAFVLKYKVLRFAIFNQGNGNGILFVQVLAEKKRGKGFVDAFELGVEGAVVELYLFDNARTFDVVVVACKLKVEDFDATAPVSR